MIENDSHIFTHTNMFLVFRHQALHGNAQLAAILSGASAPLALEAPPSAAPLAIEAGSMNGDAAVVDYNTLV